MTPEKNDDAEPSPASHAPSGSVAAPPPSPTTQAPPDAPESIVGRAAWRGVGGRIGCLLDARVSHVGPYEFQPPDLRELFGPATEGAPKAGVEVA